MGTCPKCGFNRRPADRECPRCGIVYKKYEAIEKKKAAEIRAKRTLEEAARQSEKLRRQSYEAIEKKKAAKIRKNEERTKEGWWIGCLSFIAIFLILYLTGSFSTWNSPGTGSGISSSHEAVENSAWDGSVSQVKSWLEDNLKDPGSLQFIEWSPVAKTKEGGFMVRVKYRAKNSFGGYVVENKVFFLSSTGTVTNYIDY